MSDDSTDRTCQHCGREFLHEPSEIDIQLHLAFEHPEVYHPDD
jgi:hypothetical protein